MELDNLKNIWSKENILETPQISIQKQKEIHQPLEKIRKNMRFEFWSSVVVLLLLTVGALFLQDSKLKVYSIMLLMSIILVTGFYFFKFFKLYREIDDKGFSTQESLRSLLFNFELNKQYYISYYIAFVPFLVSVFILMYSFDPSYENLSGISFIVRFILSVLVGLFFLYYAGKYMYGRYYGRYIEQVKIIAGQLKDSEDNF